MPGRVERRAVTYPVFGRDLLLGDAEYEIPPFKVTDVVPLGDPPYTSARLVFEPAVPATNLRFRMVTLDAARPETE
jgi:hypothetical protein